MPTSYYDLAVADYPAFTPARTINCSTRAQLLTAISDLDNLDDIVLTASIDYGILDLDGVSAATRARIRPASGVTAEMGSTTTASALYMRRGSNNWIIGHPDGLLILDGGGSSLSVLGIGMNSGTASSGSGKGPVSNVYFSNVLMRNSGQAGVKCGASSTNITWDWLCHITDTGNSRPDYGEGLYIGSSSASAGDVTTDIVYRGEISYCTAEAVDVKHNGILSIAGTRIHDLEQWNTLDHYNKGAVANRSGETLDATGVRIWNVIRKTGASTEYNLPVGIMCSLGTVIADGAAIWNCGGAAMYTFDEGVITADQLTAWNNNTQGDSSYDLADEGSGTTITITRSVYNGDHNATVTSSSVATSGDFVGPITGTAIADDLEGTGFALDPGSSIPTDRGAFGVGAPGDPDPPPDPGGGEVLFHDSWSASYSGGQSTVATSAPAGSSGKVGLLLITGTSGQSPGTPTGWSLLDEVYNDGTSSMEVYIRLMDGTATDSPTVGGNAIRSVVMVVLTGTSVESVTTDGPYTSASASSHDPTSVSITEDSSMVVNVAMSVFSGRTWTKPSNMTQAENGANVSRGMAAAYASSDTGTFDPTAWTLTGGSTTSLLITIVANPVFGISFGEGSGDMVLTSSADGVAGFFGSGSAAMNLTGTATGSGAGLVSGSGSAAMVLSGISSGVATSYGSGSGAMALNGTAEGFVEKYGSGSGSMALGGFATGDIPPEPLLYSDIYTRIYGEPADTSAAEAELEAALVAGHYVLEGFLEMSVFGSVVADTDSGIGLIDGRVRVERFNANRRTLSVALQGINGDAVSNYLKSYGSLLGMEITAYQEIDGNRFKLGVFVPDEVEHSQDGTNYLIELTAGDRSTHVAVNERTTRYVIENGTPYNAAFENYMLERYPSVELVMEPIEGTTPTLVFGIDEDPWQGAIRLAESFGCETYFDRFGRCVLANVADPYTATIVSEYSDTDDTKFPFVAQPLSRSINTREIYNGVIVQAEAPWLLFPVCGHKWNTDPSSETYYDPNNPGASPVGPHPKIIRDSTVGTEAAAAALAASKFNEIVGMSEPIQFIGMCDPRRDVGDVISLSAADINLSGRMAIDDIELPLTSRGGMSVGGRRIA